VGMRTDLQRGPWPLGRGGGFFDDWRQILWRPWDLWRDDLWRNLDAHLGGQRPSVDVSDAGDRIVIEAELPGAEPEDIQLDVYDDRVVIRAETRRETRDEGEGYYVAERRYGRFHRVIPLPERVDPDGAEARCRNGVLHVEIPKVQGRARGRRVPITGS